jgi:hypothetical protein
MDRQTDRQTVRQTDRQTNRETDKQTDRQTDGCTVIWWNKRTGIQIDGYTWTTDKQMDGHTYR